MHNSLEVVVEIAVKLLLGDTKKDELEDMITTLFKVDPLVHRPNTRMFNFTL